MSNCINSAINKVYILTQFNSASLNRHIARAYNSGTGVTFGDGYVEVSLNRCRVFFLYYLHPKSPYSYITCILSQLVCVCVCLWLISSHK